MQTFFQMRSLSIPVFRGLILLVPEQYHAALQEFILSIPVFRGLILLGNWLRPVTSSGKRLSIPVFRGLILLGLYSILHQA